MFAPSQILTTPNFSIHKGILYIWFSTELVIIALGHDTSTRPSLRCCAPELGSVIHPQRSANSGAAERSFWAVELTDRYRSRALVTLGIYSRRIRSQPGFILAEFLPA